MKIAAQLFAVVGCSAVVVAACWWSPDVALPALARLLATAGRAWAYAASIVLEASPYILVGAIFAAIARRAALPPLAAALFAVVGPACDCSMNGYVRVLTRAPAFVSGFAVVWAASCNPVALLATHSILGDRVMAGRIAGTSVAAFVTAVIWAALARFEIRSLREPKMRCESDRTSDWIDHFGRGLLALLPAAAISGLLIAAAPRFFHHPATPMAMGLVGAFVSPCSTADAVLARVLSPASAAQASFVLAAQTLDFRQLMLIGRNFGTARLLAAVGAAIAGCCVGAAIA